MDFHVTSASDEDKDALATLRVIAMQESLEAIGRFDPARARERFLATWCTEHTHKIEAGEQLAGFYVVEPKSDHLWLAHLYIHPDFQSKGVGGVILDAIKQQSTETGLPIRLGALRQSRSNDFYQKHGFHQTHEEEWDIYYEYRP